MNVIPIDLNIYSDEEALLTGLRAGDRHACACLLKRFAPHVYAVALRMTGDPDEAEDVLQETFISACKHVQEFEGRSALGTWLHRIATNAALMRLRRHTPDEVSLDQPIASLEGEDIPRRSPTGRSIPPVTLWMARLARSSNRPSPNCPTRCALYSSCARSKA